ncbi:MAG: ATP-binding protein [Thermoplasmatota archaeon]
MKREIIDIDEEKCNGCGECIKGCPEGAIQIIDGKARLVNEAFCDGLGACIGDCPKDAITIEKREAKPYDEAQVVERMVDKGENVLKAHLEHLKEHGQDDLLKEAVEHLENMGEEISINLDEPKTACGCPSSAPTQWENESKDEEAGSISSRLEQWPVQLNLVPVQASYFDDSDLVIAADCVPFAYADFHRDFIDGNSVVVGCPKLDDASHYQDKLASIFKHNDINSIKILHMEVPCCFGLTQLVKKALSDSGKNIPVEDITVSVKGKIK